MNVEGVRPDSQMVPDFVLLDEKDGVKKEGKRWEFLWEGGGASA
jgi:hypothetical protein